MISMESILLSLPRILGAIVVIHIYNFYLNMGDPTSALVLFFDGSTFENR